MTLKRIITSLLILLGIAIPILITDLYWNWIPFLSHTEEYPIRLTALFMALSVFITLLLALTAVRTIEESNKREVSSREERRDKEKRDRFERYLNEIIGWLIELEQGIFPSGGAITKKFIEDIKLKDTLGLPPETWSILSDLDRTIAELNRLHNEIRDGEYISKLALRINEELGSLTTSILGLLEERRQMVSNTSPNLRTIDESKAISSRLEKEHQLITELIEDDAKSLDGVTLSEEGLTTVRFARNAGFIRKAIREAIHKAIEIKISLLKS